MKVELNLNYVMNIFMMNRCTPAKIGLWLTVIGAVNWGLVGVSSFFGQNWNVVALLLGKMPVVENIVYVLVGVAGVMVVLGCKCLTCKSADCANCKAK